MNYDEDLLLFYVDLHRVKMRALERKDTKAIESLLSHYSEIFDEKFSEGLDAFCKISNKVKGSPILLANFLKNYCC